MAKAPCPGPPDEKTAGSPSTASRARQRYNIMFPRQRPDLAVLRSTVLCEQARFLGSCSRTRRAGYFADSGGGQFVPDATVDAANLASGAAVFFLRQITGW